MLEREPPEYNMLNDILLQETRKSIGCTEAAAVGLAVAATKDGQEPPYNVEIALDYDTYRNAVNVGIPGGGKGIRSAILMGLNSDWKKKLRVLSKVKPVSINLVRNINVKPLSVDTLFIYACVNNGCSIITLTHDNIVYKGSRIELEKASSSLSSQKEQPSYLRIKKIPYDAIIKAIDLLVDRKDVLERIRQGIKLNLALVKENIEGNQYCGIAKLLPNETLLQKIVRYTVAGVEARMSGSSKPAMSVAGSGNQGITTTVPFVIYAKETKLKEKDMYKAILLAWLTTIYVTAYTKYVSPVCGLGVKAGTGIAAGFGYLLGNKKYETVMDAIRNHLATIAGTVCDGAKLSCTLKAITAVETAYRSAELALKGIQCREGLLGKNVEETLRNIGEYVQEAAPLNIVIVKVISAQGVNNSFFGV